MTRFTQTLLLAGLFLASGCRSSARQEANMLLDRNVVGQDEFNHGLLSQAAMSRRSTGKPTSSIRNDSKDRSERLSKVVSASYSVQNEHESESIGVLQPPLENVIGSERTATDNFPRRSLDSISLSLGEAEQTAIENSPALIQVQAKIDSLQGKHLQSGLKPNPQVGYLAADIGEEGTAGQQGAFFSQEFIRGGKLRLNRAIVCQEIEAAKQELEISRQRLLTDVRMRFYDLLVAQERMRTVQQFNRLSRDSAAISEKLYEGEEISKIANLRSQLQAKNTSLALAQAENELTAATRRLATVIGIGSPERLDAGLVTVSGSVYPAELLTDPQTTFQNIVAASPEIHQAMAELERAKWNLNRQIAEPTRNVQVQAGLTHGNVSSDDLVAIQVGVPLRIHDRNQGNIASARSEIRGRMQNIESIKRDLSRRFGVAWRDYGDARIQIEKYENEIIPAAAEVYKLTASAYREGELGYLDMVTAQQAYLDASLQNLDALKDFWQAVSLIDGYLLSKN